MNQELDSETISIKSSKGKDEFLFAIIKNGDEISEENLIYVPVISKNIDLAKDEISQKYPNYSIAGIMPLRILLTLLSIVEEFTNDKGYDFDRLLANALMLAEDPDDNSLRNELQVYLFNVKEKNAPENSDDDLYYPVVTKSIIVAIDEFSKTNEDMEITGLMPFYRILSQLNTLEEFAEKEGYNFKELVKNAME